MMYCKWRKAPIHNIYYTIFRKIVKIFSIFCMKLCKKMLKLSKKGKIGKKFRKISINDRYMSSLLPFLSTWISSLFFSSWIYFPLGRVGFCQNIYPCYYVRSSDQFFQKQAIFSPKFPEKILCDLLEEALDLSTLLFTILSSIHRNM